MNASPTAQDGPPGGTGRAPLGVLARAVVARVVAFAVVWWALSEGDASKALYGIPAVALAVGVSVALRPPDVGGDRARGPRGRGPHRQGPHRQGPHRQGALRQGALRQGPLRRARAMCALAGWFAGQAVVGGADVALRALRRPVAIDPVVVTAPIALPSGGARQLALVMLNLMPGTLVQAHEGDEARVHALSPELPVLEQWSELQARVAAAAGVRLPADPPPEPSQSQ